MRVSKILAYAMLTGVLTVSTALTSYAGEWTERDGTWSYLNEDGTYAANQWIISGDHWFYVDSEGYMLTNATTPDGYIVDEMGVWTVDGVAQIVETNTIENARQAIYDNQNGSFSAKKEAVFKYFEALGCDTTGLSITEGVGIHYSSYGAFGDADKLYDLLKYNSQNALNQLSKYMGYNNYADEFIKAVDDYLNRT